MSGSFTGTLPRSSGGSVARTIGSAPNLVRIADGGNNGPDERSPEFGTQPWSKGWNGGNGSYSVSGVRHFLKGGETQHVFPKENKILISGFMF